MNVASEKGTQCNFYMLNKPKTTSRGTTVNVKLKVKNVGMQTPKKFAEPASSSSPTMITNEKATDSDRLMAMPTTFARADSDRLDGAGGTETTCSCRAGRISRPTTRNMHVQCTVPMTSASTQTPSPWEVLSIKTEEEMDTTSSVMEQAFYVLRTVSDFWVLDYEVKVSASGSALLVMTRPDMLGSYGHGLEPIRITLDMNCMCTVNRLFCPVVTSNVAKKHLAFELDIGLFMETLRPHCHKELILCPGIKNELVSISPANVTSLNIPFCRHMSKKCVVWYAQTSESNAKTTACLHCRYLTKYLLRSRLPKKNITPGKKYRQRQITKTPMRKQVRINGLAEARRDSHEKSSQMETG